MSTVDIRLAMRVIQADGWPGGPRIIEGMKRAYCIHRRPLRTQDWGDNKIEARGNLCRLCEFEAPRFARVSNR